MNKIYLDKLCEFTSNIYTNYEILNNNFNICELINNIKQNNSLNEKGIFLKHNLIECKSVFSYIKYDQLILINPICFNLYGNIEWYSFLNSLLTVLNENYLNEPNLIKKTILEIADKNYRQKIIFENTLNENNIKDVCILTNIILFCIKESDIKIYNYENNKTNNIKIIVLININNEYYPIINWNKKYFDINSNFISYLIEITNNKTISQISKEKNEILELINNEEEIKLINNEEEIKLINNEEEIKLINNEEEIKLINKDSYKELTTKENYALYISEAIENNQNLKKQINISDSKKKKKKDKNIFVLNQIDNTNNNLLNKNTIKIKNIETSTFIKTDKITKKDIDEISTKIKLSLNLEQIQSYAFKLGINIFEGATKTGKPKNKKKSELIENIKIFCENYK